MSDSVPGNGYRAASIEAHPELLNRVRGVALGKAGMLFQQALDRVDDALFGYSEKSGDGLANNYLDAMREIRLKRADVSQRFLGEVAGNIARFRRRAAAVARAPEPNTELSLVDDTQLEQNLAVDAMATKACAHYASALFALNQRLAALLATDNVSDGENPLGPPQLCTALQVALRELGADVPVQFVLLKLFDRHLIGELDALYDEANQSLAAAGVLPHIKYTLPVRAHDGPAAAPAATHAPAIGPVAGAQASVATAAANEILATLSALLGARRRAERGLALDTFAAPRISDDELLAAIALLQSELRQGGHVAASPIEQVERVKQDLIEQLRRIGVPDPDRRVASSHEDAIDLAAMLFQFVVQDRNLPAEIQALLCRMQIPYVRVALKDRHLFAQREHPARLLLNAMAVAGVGWSPQGDRDGALLAQMRTVVDRVVREFDDDVALFEELRRDFEAFLIKQSKRVELTEHRTAETAQGQEKLTLARRHALHAVAARISGRPLPQLVHDTLMSPWINYLVLMDLRHGTHSREWKSAVNFVEALIWSVQPKTEKTQLARLDALLPQLQAFLRRGLGLVGFHGTDIERIADGIGVLAEATREAARPAPPRTDVLQEAESSLRAVVARTVAEADADEDDDVQPAVLPEDEWLQRVRALKVGTWIEFTVDGGLHERAKLSWISTLSARFLFVNGKGLKVAERSLPTLAQDLREQRAIVLDVAPICDRALEAILARLRDEHAQAAGHA